MGTEFVQVKAVISGLWFSGAMQLTGVRVQDVFRDGTSAYFRLLDARLSQGPDGATEAAALPEMVVPKEKVELLVIPESRHEAPDLLISTFTTKRTAEVFLIAGGYAVQGSVHLEKESNDPVYALTNQLGKFFPVTRAKVSAVGELRSEPLLAPVVLVNKDAVYCLNLKKECSAQAACVQLPAAFDVATSVEPCPTPAE